MALRRLMTEVRVVVPEERMTYQEAGDRYLHHLEHVKRRKPSTIQDYKHHPQQAPRASLRLASRWTGSRPARGRQLHHGEEHGRARQGRGQGRPEPQDDRQPPQLRARRVRVCGQARMVPPRIRWRRPTGHEMEQTDPDIRFLDLAELEALLRAAASWRQSRGGRDEPDVRGPTDHALYLTAAMTGMREGELVALRWRDVDWSASVIRVRRNYTRGSRARRSPSAPRERCRWPTGSAASSTVTTSARPTKATMTSCSATRRPEIPTTPRRCASASTRR